MGQRRGGSGGRPPFAVFDFRFQLSVEKAKLTIGYKNHLVHSKLPEYRYRLFSAVGG